MQKQYTKSEDKFHFSKKTVTLTSYATGGRSTWSCEVSTAAGGKNCHMATPG